MHLSASENRTSYPPGPLAQAALATPTDHGFIFFSSTQKKSREKSILCASQHKRGCCISRPQFRLTLMPTRCCQTNCLLLAQISQITRIQLITLVKFTAALDSSFQDALTSESICWLLHIIRIPKDLIFVHSQCPLCQQRRITSGTHTQHTLVGGVFFLLNLAWTLKL